MWAYFRLRTAQWQVPRGRRSRFNLIETSISFGPSPGLCLPYFRSNTPQWQLATAGVACFGLLAKPQASRCFLQTLSQDWCTRQCHGMLDTLADTFWPCLES